MMDQTKGNAREARDKEGLDNRKEIYGKWQVGYNENKFRASLNE